MGYSQSLYQKVVAVDSRPAILPPTADIPLLKALSNSSRRPGPTVLVVLDGFGIGSGKPTEDAIAAYLESNPKANWSRLLRNRRTLFTRLAAHGPAVGLPGNDDMGNSEVGHNAIGAGRPIDQGASIIRKLIQSDEFHALPRLTELMKHVLQSDSTLHLAGLLQTSGVHAHIDHVKALVKAADRKRVQRIRIHALTDARDDSPEASIPLMQDLVSFLQSFDTRGRDFRVASGGGRMWLTMDRYEADWKMVARGWNAHVHGIAELQVTNPMQGIEEGRRKSHTDNPLEIDQFLPDYVVVNTDGTPIGKIQDGDSVIFWNFRGDRAIEISLAFEQGDEFAHFDRGRRPNIQYAGMMLYDGDKKVPNSYLVAMPRISQTLGEILVYNGEMLLAGAETQKYGHITSFINGNYSGPFDSNREQYIEIPSEDSRLFAKRPKMMASRVTDALLTAYKLNPAIRFIRVNYANPDMVGHTGVFSAVVEAIRAVDLEIGRWMKFIKQTQGILLITADHGNADEMVKKGKPCSSHSLNAVPFIIYDPLSQPGDYQLDSAVPRPTLSHVSPTLFALSGYEPPHHMERPLITFSK